MSASPSRAPRFPFLPPPIRVPDPKPPLAPLQDLKLGAPPPCPAPNLPGGPSPALRELRRWVRWARVMWRREGCHRRHTLEKIILQTPSDANNSAPEAAMPQRAVETLPQDAVQGLCHPYTLKPSAGGSRPPSPRHGPLAPHRLRHQPSRRAPERERAKRRPAARGRGKAQGEGHALTGTRHHGQHNMRARNQRRAINTGIKKEKGPQQ